MTTDPDIEISAGARELQAAYAACDALMHEPLEPCLNESFEHSDARVSALLKLLATTPAVSMQGVNAKMAVIAERLLRGPEPVLLPDEQAVLRSLRDDLRRLARGADRPRQGTSPDRP